MAVVEEFCMAVKDKWPHALIQFEDFQTDRAFEILERLQDKVLCFNDDIQVHNFNLCPLSETRTSGLPSPFYKNVR
jgi:hypothetical protein